MKEDNKKKLESLLNKYDERETAQKQEVQKVQEVRNKFLDGFDKLCADIIKPAMEEIGATLKAQGHDFKIGTQQEKKDDKGVLLDARITMNIFPKGKGSPHGYSSSPPAHVMFFADKYKEEIGVHENNIVPSGGSGSAGGKGKKYTLTTLTKEAVEEEIVDSLGKILKLKGNF